MGRVKAMYEPPAPNMVGPDHWALVFSWIPKVGTAWDRRMEEPVKNGVPTPTTANTLLWTRRWAPAVLPDGEVPSSTIGE